MAGEIIKAYKIMSKDWSVIRKKFPDNDYGKYYTNRQMIEDDIIYILNNSDINELEIRETFLKIS